MPSQVERFYFLLNKLQSGRTYTTNELFKSLNEEFGNTSIIEDADDKSSSKNISLRTLQRDMNLIKEVTGEIVETEKNGASHWKMNIEKPKLNSAFLQQNPDNFISLHILKAYLKNFQNTGIEEAVDLLIQKLNDLVPGNIYNSESLYWDQNIGTFDYTQYDPIIRKTSQYIKEHKWAKVKYNAAGRDKTKEYIVNLRCIFTYAGTLYTVAYQPNHKSHIALAIHLIEELNEIENFQEILPNFDFKSWANERFGVFSGEPKTVKLFIEKEFIHYFQNRKWHQSQLPPQYDKKGNMTLEMTVPLTVDLISWIISWNEAVTVLEPQELIEKVKSTLIKTLENYEIINK